MYFYILVALLTSGLFYVADVKSHTPFAKWSLLALAFLIPTVIEGCRDLDIGTDMETYVIYFFQEAKGQTSLIRFLGRIGGHEYAYHLLNYLCAKVGEIYVFLMAVATIKTSLLFLTAWNLRKYINTFVFLFCYMLFFYWYEFSLMRQGLAINVCFYSLTFLMRQKHLKFLICILIAYLFHSSAIFMLFAPVLFRLSYFKNRYYITLGGILAMYLMASFLFVVIASSGLFSEEKAELYADSGVAIAKTNILISIAYFIISFLYKTKKKGHLFLIRSSACLSIAFLMLANLFEVAFRVAFYPLLLLMIYILVYLKPRQLMQQLYVYAGLISIYLLHIFIAASHGLADTAPYKSIILGI